MVLLGLHKALHVRSGAYPCFGINIEDCVNPVFKEFLFLVWKKCNGNDGALVTTFTHPLCCNQIGVVVWHRQ